MTNTSSSSTKKMTPGQAAIVGGIAGALEITAAYPVEFSKVIMQLYPKYNNMGFINVIKHTIRKDGFFGLYRGYNLLLAAGVPKAYVRFGTYEYLTQNVITTKSIVNTTVCGAIAGALEGLLVHVPVENMKVKLIHDRFKNPPQFKNIFHGIYKVATEKGINGLTSGTAITMMKEGSNHAIRFPLFMGLQTLANKFIHNQVLRDLTAGAATGIFCVAINQPLDVIKTNLQGLNAHKFKGTVDCAKQIVRHEGVMGLYKGVKPRMARVAIEVSVTFASYNAIKETVLKYLEAAE
uniref:Uncharacterized protein n=1 Tax=Euplotes harpa TaxID=151035 RepID=A0A7S3JG27_9SPIT|mmetsp:Transcript_34191/g.39473  ORF Transcript_34191/g.39473 Transcript_34191/m.39473 type:complete len:293 (+) Transcript_34191:68-946(+)